MCSKVVVPTSIIETFETLLSSAATILDEETGNPSWQPCADFYVYCILASLPWGGPELFEVTSNTSFINCLDESPLSCVASHTKRRRISCYMCVTVSQIDTPHTKNKMVCTHARF